jgi:cytochrome c-type biogenesis protein CcmH
MKRSLSKVVVVCLLLAPGAWAGAQQNPLPRLDEPVQPHPEGDAAIGRLLSPFCPGLMLEVCPSPQAKLLRDTLQMMAQEGASSDSLVGWMLATYGEKYRAVPRTSGSGLWAWVMPPLALVGGAVLVGVALRHFRARARAVSSAPARAAPITPEDETALAAALQELKRSEEVSF